MRDRRLCRWAVSQASPLRRLLVTENLKLYEYRGGGAAGWASGGFLGNSVVKGIVVSGSCHLALPWLCVSILTTLLPSCTSGVRLAAAVDNAQLQHRGLG